MEKQILRLKDEIIQTIPDKLTKMEQVRYLYIELGKMVSFDERYWKGNSETRNKIYKGSFRKKIEDLRSDRRVVCVSLSRMYMELLKEIGIDSYIYQPDSEDPHVVNIVGIEGKRYVMDLKDDLEYIQTNRRTKSFGRRDPLEYIDFAEVSEEETERIDRKIGYIQEGRDYSESYLWMLKKAIECKEISLDEKVGYILEHAREYKDISKLGIVEKSRFYKWCLDECLSKEEQKSVSKNFWQTIKDKKIISCISVKGKNNNYSRYVFQEGEDKYLKTDEEEFEYLLQTRLQSLQNKKIPGYKKNKPRNSKAKSRNNIEVKKEENRKLETSDKSR